MSLVAYGASDDSEDSESEYQKEEGIKGVPISDDDEEIQTNSTTSSISSILSLPTTGGATKQDSKPPGKIEENAIEETELEPEVRQKPSELADAPKPPPKRTKQPVRITIPSLSEIPDDEEDISKPKPVASIVRSGLFSLLPAPIHSAKKEINRPLIPHSLGKKIPTKPAPVPAKSTTSSSNTQPSKKITSDESLSKGSAVKHAFMEYGSDSNDEDDETGTSQNFFSLGSTTSGSGNKNNSDIGKETSTAKVERKEFERNTEIKTTITTETILPEDEPVAPPEPGLTNDSPLSFSNVSKFSSWSSASSNYLGGFRPNQPSQASISGHYPSYPQSSSSGQETSVQYNMVDADVEDIDDADADLQKVLSDKEFQKLNGKRKRGMEEAINFVDAKVDDYVDPSELSKYLTEEMEYQPKKSDDMPTSQQKRKKQITYLAFQAKEKELELKNTWSQNKMTRRQTQAKYGF